MTIIDATLVHQERTLADIFNEMTPEQKDFQALIVGAAIDEESFSEAPEVIEQYNSLSEEHMVLIDFIVGNIMAEAYVVKHDDLDVDNFLAHFGVKGMKWGVVQNKINGPNSLSRSSANTPEGRTAARAAVSQGRTTKKNEHLAALKSTGHRAINALSGDKTFWRRMAITGGIAVASLAVPLLGAELLPAAVLSAIGSTSVGTALAGGSSTSMTTMEIGQWALASVGFHGAGGVVAGGAAVAAVGNTARAVAGNSMINRSYARVGKTLVDRQSAGKKRVINVLKTVGGIRDQDLKHSATEYEGLSNNPEVDNFLAHFGVKGMQWGKRTTRPSGGSSGTKTKSSPKAKTSGKIGNGDGKISKSEVKAGSIAAGKIALKYGAVPGAIAIGGAVGLPAVAALGVSVRALQDPTIQAAALAASKFVKDTIPDIGSIPMPKVPKIDNPFSMSASDKARLKSITTRANEIAAEAKAQTKQLDKLTKNPFGTRTTSTGETVKSGPGADGHYDREVGRNGETFDTLNPWNAK